MTLTFRDFPLMIHQVLATHDMEQIGSQNRAAQRRLQNPLQSPPSGRTGRPDSSNPTAQGTQSSRPRGLTADPALPQSFPLAHRHLRAPHAHSPCPLLGDAGVFLPSPSSHSVTAPPELRNSFPSSGHGFQYGGSQTKAGRQPKPASTLRLYV